MALSLQAAPAVLEDFESYAVGTELPMWSYWGNAITSKATVVKDPTNAANKVLHIELRDWGCFVPMTLPESLAGGELCAQKDYVTLRLYRAAGDQNDYKKFMIYQGKTLLWEDDGYPEQGAKGTWQQRQYQLPASSDATGRDFALGLNSDWSDYYIDDVVVRSEFDDYLVVGPDEQVDLSGQNTSSSYKTWDTPMSFVEGSHLTMKTARYTYLTSKAVGEGRIDLYSGGERTYLGGSDKKAPDWSAFKGDVHVWPYKVLSGSNGFYGLVWMHNGKTFNADAVMSDMADGKACSTLSRSRLTMHAGTTLAAESGTRAIRIGHLEMEEGSQLYGYMKSKDDNNTYYIVGATGDDATLAGRISPVSDNQKMRLGLIKEGLGTYRITNSQNQISGGVRVLRGRVMVNNRMKINGLYIMKDGVAGGTGTVDGTVNVYGILQPGDDSRSELTVTQKLILRPSARIDCEIVSATDYDRVKVEDAVSYYNIAQDFSTSELMPRLRLLLSEDAQLQVGDTFELLTAGGKESYGDVAWEMNIVYPKRYTWSVEQQLTEAGYRVVARVTSLEYGGQGEASDDYDDDPENSTDDGLLDLDAEVLDSTPLREYASLKGHYIGTCVPVWSINVDNEEEPRAKLIAEQYNAVVCENEMKFDATEPNQGDFSFYHGDRLVNFAERHGMRVRGHALAWHQQVPAWLTADGNRNTKNRSREELLAILKNHITNVVSHWKGRVAEWDVANEVLSDDQTSIYSNPSSYDLRPSVWATGIGEDFLDSAFVWTHAIDPDAILILNDYGVEGKGWGKSEALYNLAMRLKNSGIPINGVGLQAHMDVGLGYLSSIEQNIARYQQAGLLCHITELDLGMDGNTQSIQEEQARNYYALARMAMKYENCGTLMIWGLSDDLTWRNGKRPLLYDANLNAKPAYWGVHAALRQSAGKEIQDLDEIEVESGLEESQNAVAKTYNLFGFPVENMVEGQIYVRNGRKIKLLAK